MLHEIFYWIFNMSITASVTGLVILLLRLIKKIPRRVFVIVWAIPFLRLIVPVGINSPFSLMTLLTKLSTKSVVVLQPTEHTVISAANTVQAAGSYFPITYKTNVLAQVFGVASTVWVIVFLAIVIMLAVIYITTMREMKDAEPWQERVYFSDKCTMPAVYGILKPKIILPVSYKGKDTELVLLHEKTHIHRCDNLWRMLAFLTVAMHWFNPLCWVYLKAFLADLELACDECVLAKLGTERKKDYALVLLEGGEGKTVFASTLGGARVRTRIENILSFKKITWVSVVAFTGLLLAMFCMLLTNAG